MKKVITYGTYDLLHYGHIRLLKRAKELGDYLIVGVTSDAYDKVRGKINVQQSLMERIEAVKATGIADQIIVEEYDGQKIDDIQKYSVDIFTVGSDWKGKFDYLNEYCKVIYLDRTEGISSSEIRAEKREIKLGLLGSSPILNKFERESHFVNGVSISGICCDDVSALSENIQKLPLITQSVDTLLDASDAIYIISEPTTHYDIIKKALLKQKHVLVESPIALQYAHWKELTELAEKNNCILMDGIKTAYADAYKHLKLLVKSGVIGKVVSIDCTCTSLRPVDTDTSNTAWNSLCAWGPTALLPIFQLLGTDYKSRSITTHLLHPKSNYDMFTKVDFIYKDAVASLKVGQGVKSEGELIISSSKGYIYVPAPWWKTDYFEIRYENPADNKRYFYQLDGEGIRYEIVSFIKAIQTGINFYFIDKSVSSAITSLIEDFYNKKDITLI
ncbi:MAG: adenylyltransferase/cytidyltransferase family protein [Treponema sp.]|nr:adenylyltransferase/cytidyltransferase family protein [Treponema sp.]